ncbi:hypothetical protein ACFRJ8_14965 [Arthrobacter sp. NPDC056886]|uniref:hypothetical protein n=1 Tax=Arthrobacter sp. NPDC056886 TaxID=3345960 RepID=UPI00366F8983
MDIVTDDEYALICKNLPACSVEFFDRMRFLGLKLGDVDKMPHLFAWGRAVEAAQGEGLGRYVRAHDLRATWLHHAYA